jgi:hypothetical protein
MLYVRSKLEKPEQFKGSWKLSEQRLGIQGFQYIEFNLRVFISEKEYITLMDWCAQPKNQYIIRASFNVLSNKEYWSVLFLFAGSSMRVEIRNNSFKKLIAEVKKFCYYLGTE